MLVGAGRDLRPITTPSCAGDFESCRRALPSIGLVNILRGFPSQTPANGFTGGNLVFPPCTALLSAVLEVNALVDWAKGTQRPRQLVRITADEERFIIAGGSTSGKVVQREVSVGQRVDSLDGHRSAK